MNGTDTMTMAVNEDDVVDLSKTGTWALKSMVRPDTARIGTAFDEMMERVKFARRLSVLSMEWSGNFSQEEYLALAQDISDEDMPGFVTLESFKYASTAGSTTLSQGFASFSRKRRDESSTLVDEVGLGSGPLGGAEGRREDVENVLRTTLQQAASKARSEGQDVWRLLDSCIQASLAEARGNDDDDDSDDDDDTPTSEEVEAQAYLSPDTLRNFMSKLDIPVLPSASSPSSSFRPLSVSAGGLRHMDTGEREQRQQSDGLTASSRSPAHRAHGGDVPLERRVGGGEAPAPAPAPAPPAVSSFLSARNAFEVKPWTAPRGGPRSRGGGSPGRSPRGGSPVRSPPSSSAQSPPSVCDRYLRAISRDTASVRCRVQLYQQELDRTRGEAESLLARAKADEGASLEYPPRLDMSGGGSPWPATGSIGARTERDNGGGGDGGGGAKFVAEIGGRTAALNGGNGGGAIAVSPAGSTMTFSRITPVERADPSHPRMELRSRSPPASLPSARRGQAPHVGASSSGMGGSGGDDGERRTPAGGGVRRDSGDEEPKAVVSDRVAKLLLAALEGARANGSESPGGPSPSAAERKMSTSKATCFDPPSVRNGMAGLTADHVDKVLLRVEASTPGAVSSWMSPVGRKKPGTSRTDVLTPSTHGRRRQLGRTQEESVGWFDEKGSARGMLSVKTEGLGEGGRGTPGIRRGKGGGGRRRKRTMMKIKLPPRTPKTPKTPKHVLTPKAQNTPKAQKTPRTPTTRAAVGGSPGPLAETPPRPPGRSSMLGKDQTGWEALGKRLDAEDDFVGENPMFSRPVDFAGESKLLQHTMPARPRRPLSFGSRRAGGGASKRAGGGPSSFSPSHLLRGSNSSYSPAELQGRVGRSYSESAYPEYDTGRTATTVRGTRRPVRAFQRLDEDVYDSFLNCTKSRGREGKALRRKPSSAL